MFSEGPFKFWVAGAKSGTENLRSRSDLIFQEFLEFADFSQSTPDPPTSFPTRFRPKILSSRPPRPTADSTIQNDRDNKNR